MKGVGRQLHPEDPSLRQPLYRRHQSRSPPAGAYGVTGPDPQRASQADSDPWSQCSARILRRDLRYRIYAPPATRNRADAARARRATPPISAGQSVGKAVEQGVKMRNGGSKTDEANLAVYAELQPIDRHRPFIDHLVGRRDRGRLTGIGRDLFASPFSEIAVVGRRPDDDVGDNDGAVVWKAIHLPPRFGRQPRQHSFHGWMLGIRCRPLDLATGDAALVGLSELFTATVEGNSENPFDPMIGALDAWIEHLRPRFNAATPLQRRTPEIAAAFEGALSASGLDRGTSVASLAAAVGVVPRTLQRHFRNRTGLAPKRYAAVQRFNGALRQVAL